MTKYVSPSEKDKLLTLLADITYTIHQAETEDSISTAIDDLTSALEEANRLFDLYFDPIEFDKQMKLESK